MARPEADEPPDAPATTGPVRSYTRTIALWCLPGALLALGMCIYICTLPNILFGDHEYDDGVYLGAALRLVHGVVPYRDFVIVHPPGIVILMTPIAALSGHIGANVCMAIARDLTFLVGSVNPILAGLAVRYRGRTAAVVASVSVACFPMAIAADQSLLLEPYLMFFGLLGICLLFSEGRLASPRRVMLGGMALGFAASVKIWGLFVIAAAALVCLRQVKRALPAVVAGVTVGFGAPCLPFFLMAPAAFVRDIFGDQFERVVTGTATFSAGERLMWITGLPGITLVKGTAVMAVALALLVVAFHAQALIPARRSVLPADLMIIVAAVASVGAMWVPNGLIPHYVYFPAVFLSLLMGVTVSMTVTRLQSRLPGMSRRRWTVAALCALALVAGVLIPQQAGYARSNLSTAQNTTFLNLFMSSDSCIVSDDIALVIEAGLFRANRRDCPDLVDSYGTWLAQGPGTNPGYSGEGRSIANGFEGPYPSVFENEWGRWLSQADFVLMYQRWSPYIPWTPQLKAWFSSNFHLVNGQSGLWIFEHVRRTPPPVFGGRTT